MLFNFFHNLHSIITIYTIHSIITIHACICGITQCQESGNNLYHFYYKKIKISIKKAYFKRFLFWIINVINLYLLKQNTFYIKIIYYKFQFFNSLKMYYLIFFNRIFVISFVFQTFSSINFISSYESLKWL